MTIVEHAPAKLNLALHVRARRDDGYHELDTLFAFVRHGDRLRIEPADRDTFHIEGPFGHALAADADNLVLRAVDAFRTVFGTKEPLSITLSKELPIASGIGGGSADAAATLRAMARMADVALDAPELFAIARDLGADVPVCLWGKSAIGRGRGEALTAVTDVPSKPCLLVNPGVAVSTRAVFAGWDGTDRGALPADGTAAIIEHGRNDLEAPARVLAPAIGDVLSRMATFDGIGVHRMSGSGATCFAMFDTAADRATAAAALRRECPAWWCLETELA